MREDVRKAITESSEFLRLAVVLLVCFCAAVINARDQNARPIPPTPVRWNTQTAGRSAAKVKLNGEDVGTTVDTSVLVRRLTGIFERRSKLALDVPVFIRAEDGARFGEVDRVVEAIRKCFGTPYLAVENDAAGSGKAPGDPVLTSYDLLQSGEIVRDTLPRSMMLVVTVGDLGSARGELISGGIQIFLAGFTLPFSERRSVPKEFVAVEVFRDNEYLINDKPVPSAALRNELRSRLSRSQDKRVLISTRSDSEIRWDSFREAADAAREAGAGMIHVLILTP